MKECKHPTCGETCRRKKDKPKKTYTLKKKYYPLKRTPIKKTSSKQRKILGEKKVVRNKDWEFFLEIWEEREHFSFESGQYLGSEPLTLYFHHVLPKRAKKDGGYPEYRYCKWNIVLLTWEEHSKAENNMDFVPKVKEYHNLLLTKIKNNEQI